MEEIYEKEFSPMYAIGSNTSFAIFDVLYGVEAYGAEHVPKRGAFLLACNHVSFFDPFLVGAPLKRDIYYFARKTLFKEGLASWIMHGFKALPVNLDGGTDVSALKTVLNLLKEGEGLLVFPEGTRSEDGELKPAKKGVGMMACRTQVPVVPARIFGTYEAWGKGKKFPRFGMHFSVVYGKPIYPETYDPGKKNVDRYQMAADRILEGIGELVVPKPVVV